MFAEATDRRNWQHYVIIIKYWLVYHIIFTIPSGRAGYDTRSIFLVEFNRFEFRVFLLIDWLPHQGWRTQSVLLFAPSRRENNWIHTFPKGFSSMWNAISLVQVWTRVAVSISYEDNQYTMCTWLVYYEYEITFPSYILLIIFEFFFDLIWSLSVTKYGVLIFEKYPAENVPSHV